MNFCEKYCYIFRKNSISFKTYFGNKFLVVFSVNKSSRRISLISRISFRLIFLVLNFSHLLEMNSEQTLRILLLNVSKRVEEKRERIKTKKKVCRVHSSVYCRLVRSEIRSRQIPDILISRLLVKMSLQIAGAATL